MERNDSSSAMASLVAMYTEHSDDEGEREDSSQRASAVDDISDDEVEQRPSSRPVLEETQTPSPANVERLVKPIKRNTTRLVSYATDEIEDGDASDRESDEESGSEAIIVDHEAKLDTSLDAEQASSLSRSVQNKAVDEIELPPEPPGKAPRPLQEKIAKLYERMRREGLNTNAAIKRRKDFRNPSIYEKLIEFCHIDEKGTNYPPEIYDPHSWGKESFYDALDKAQKIEMEKREKERKERTKIEFVTGTKKSSSDGPPDEKKRKSKWDAQPQNVLASRPGVVNPSVASLTSSITGTKSTVIPAVGTITKKPK